MLMGAWLRRTQGEIFAAEGWAKVTGKVGVCIATSGPGATNLVTGLADAMMDSVPLVAITGQVRVVLLQVAAAHVVGNAWGRLWLGWVGFKAVLQCGQVKGAGACHGCHMWRYGGLDGSQL